MQEGMRSHSMSTESPKAICCPSCPKTFSRRTHMLRHAQQHSNHGHFCCSFCSKGFARSDVLADHYRRCKSRGTAAIPANQGTGRKKHACTECARMKVKCDNGIPCLRCKKAGRQCLRSTTEELDSDISAGAELPRRYRTSIQFLLNDRRNSDFAGRFPKSDTENIIADINESPSNDDDSQMQCSEFEQADPSCVVDPHDYFFDTNLDFEALFEELETRAYAHSFMPWPSVQSSVASALQQGDSLLGLSLDDHTDALVPRALEIREQICNAITSFNIPEQPLKVGATFEALDILTPQRIEAFIKLYFQHWHRHGPIIHEQSFSPSKVSLSLLISVLAIGGMYSGDIQEVSKLKLLLDFMEIAVYSNVTVEDEYELRQSSLTLEKSEIHEQLQLEEFQAAYLMVVVQYWAGNPLARKRVRQQRFMRLVSIVRSREVFMIQCHENFTISNEQDFRSWIRRESFLRTMGIMMTLDNAFGIFNNLPPRFTWSELNLELPCKPESFRATSYEHMSAYSIFPRRKLKVTTAFEKFFLCASSQSGRFDPVEKGSLSPLDLQIIIHVFYTFIWQQLFASPISHVLQSTLTNFIPSVKSALCNWKRIWDEEKNEIAPTEWVAMGFPSSAESYWILTQSVLHGFEHGGRKPILSIVSDVEETGAHLRPVFSKDI